MSQPNSRSAAVSAAVAGASRPRCEGKLALSEAEGVPSQQPAGCWRYDKSPV